MASSRGGRLGGVQEEKEKGGEGEEGAVRPLAAEPVGDGLEKQVSGQLDQGAEERAEVEIALRERAGSRTSTSQQARE